MPEIYWKINKRNEAQDNFSGSYKKSVIFYRDIINMLPQR